MNILSPRPSVIKLLAEVVTPLFRFPHPKWKILPTAGLCLLHGQVLHVPADSRLSPPAQSPGGFVGPQSCFTAPGPGHSALWLLRRHFDVASAPLKVCSHPVYPRICWAHAYSCSRPSPPPFPRHWNNLGAAECRFQGPPSNC